MVSFALGLFIGFCLGILCMVLLFQAKASDTPTNPSFGSPDDEAVSYQQSAVSSQQERDAH